MNKAKSFWKDGLSVTETKFSVIGLLLVLSFVVCLIDLAVTKQLEEGLLRVFDSLLLAFAGVSAIDRVSVAYEARNEMDEGVVYDEYADEMDREKGGL